MKRLLCTLNQQSSDEKEWAHSDLQLTSSSSSRARIGSSHLRSVEVHPIVSSRTSTLEHLSPISTSREREKNNLSSQELADTKQSSVSKSDCLRPLYSISTIGRSDPRNQLLIETSTVTLIKEAKIDIPCAANASEQNGLTGQDSPDLKSFFPSKIEEELIRDPEQFILAREEKTAASPSPSSCRGEGKSFSVKQPVRWVCLDVHQKSVETNPFSSDNSVIQKNSQIILGGYLAANLVSRKA